jgi:hypothetical protein
LVPATAPAESVTFANETNLPLVVQVASVIGGFVRRDRPCPVPPGVKIRIPLPGNKLINVYDARGPNRVLYQGRIPASNEDQHFAIRTEFRGPQKVRLDLVKPR